LAKAEALVRADAPFAPFAHFSFQLSAFSFQLSAFSLLLPHYHVATRIQVVIFNKAREFSAPRRLFCQTKELNHGPSFAKASASAEALAGQAGGQVNADGQG
jgi:hypothetical protein